MKIEFSKEDLVKYFNDPIPLTFAGRIVADVVINYAALTVELKEPEPTPEPTGWHYPPAYVLKEPESYPPARDSAGSAAVRLHASLDPVVKVIDAMEKGGAER